MTASDIAKALGGRKCGAGWVAKCPGHEDRSPSLSIRDGEGGKILVHDFAGCEQATVIQALRERGLWPEHERTLTPAERQRWARARRQAKPLARAALWWWRERVEQLEEAKAAVIQGDHIDIDRLRAAAQEARRLREMDADGIVAAYIRARDCHPRETAELVRQGAAWANACRRAVQAILARIERELTEGLKDAA